MPHSSSAERLVLALVVVMVSLGDGRPYLLFVFTNLNPRLSFCPQFTPIFMATITFTLNNVDGMERLGKIKRRSAAEEEDWAGMGYYYSFDSLELDGCAEKGSLTCRCLFQILLPLVELILL